MITYMYQASLVAQMVKNSPATQETWIWSLVWEDPMEEGMEPTSLFLPGEPPWTEKLGRLQSMGSWRVGHNWASSLSLFTFMHWRRKWQLQCSCLENPRDRGAWWVAVYGVSQSQTWLKRLSSSSSRLVIAFLPRSKRLLISWLQSLSTVIFSPRKWTLSLFPHLFAMKW